MTAVITLLHVCGCCRVANGIPFTAADPEGNEIHGFTCDPCLSEIGATLNRVRPVFAAMLAAGVPSEIASDTMTYLLGRIDP